MHVFMDWWGTKIWTRTTEVVTPLGFKLTAGVHPAYQQMQEGRFEVAETALLSKLLMRVDRFIDVVKVSLRRAESTMTAAEVVDSLQVLHVEALGEVEQHCRVADQASHRALLLIMGQAEHYRRRPAPAVSHGRGAI